MSYIPITASGLTVSKKTFYQRTVLYDNTLSGSGSWDVTSIDQTYDHLELLIWGRSTRSAGTDELLIAFNNDTTDANYNLSQLYTTSSSVTGGTANARNTALVVAATQSSNRFSPYRFILQNYTDSSKYKSIIGMGRDDADTTSSAFHITRSLTWKNTAAIDRIGLAAEVGSIAAGSRLQIIGMKAEAVVIDVT